MTRSSVSRITRPEPDRARGLAEVSALAWLLDNSIPVPGTGRRFGIDAIIGLVPVAGDLVSGGVGLYVVWRGTRLGLPGIVVARMLANWGLDVVVGAIPFAGDAFDLWFKASSRNLGLMRHYLEEPEASTRGQWIVVGAILATIAAVILLVGWLLVSLLGAIAGALGLSGP